MELFRKGVAPSDVATQYPAIPLGTLKTWCRKVNQSSDGFKSSFKSTAVESIEKPLAVEVVSSPGNPPRLAALPTAESDYWHARRVAVEILRDRATPAPTRVQAVSAVAKLLELERDLPKHILEQRTETGLDDERKPLHDMDAAELAKRYREAL